MNDKKLINLLIGVAIGYTLANMSSRSTSGGFQRMIPQKSLSGIGCGCNGARYYPSNFSNARPHYPFENRNFKFGERYPGANRAARMVV